jgi:hypothetical protein
MRSRIPTRTSFLFISSLPFFRLYLFRRVLGCFIRPRERVLLPECVEMIPKPDRPQKYGVSQTKIRYSPYSASAPVLIRLGKSGNFKVCHTSRKSDGGRDSQCPTVYVDGKCGYVRDGKPACPIWSDHLRLARRGGEIQGAYPIILGLSFANRLTSMVSPFDPITAHRR